jgi:hypothetical protein
MVSVEDPMFVSANARLDCSFRTTPRSSELAGNAFALPRRYLVAPAGSSITYSCVLRQGFRRRAAGGAVRVLMFQTTSES